MPREDHEPLVLAGAWLVGRICYATPGNSMRTDRVPAAVPATEQAARLRGWGVA